MKDHNIDKMKKEIEHLISPIPLDHWCIDNPRQDSIDPDTKWSKLLRHGLGVTNDSCLAGTVVGVSGCSIGGSDAGNVHDGPLQLLILHQTCCSLNNNLNLKTGIILWLPLRPRMFPLD